MKPGDNAGLGDGGDADDDCPCPEDYIGYGHPPKKTQWPSGFCPNRLGRPRKNQTRKFYLELVAYREVEIRDRHRVRRITVLEAIILSLKAKAIAGNEAALRQYERLLGVDTVDHEEQAPKGVFFCPEKLTADEWMAKYGQS